MRQLFGLLTSLSTYGLSTLTPELLNEIISILTQIILLVWTLISLVRRKKPTDEIIKNIEVVEEKLENVKSKMKK